MRKRSGDYQSAKDTIKVVTIKVSKGLEFHCVATPGIGRSARTEGDEKDDARLFYVATTRATDKSLLTMGGDGRFGVR